MPESRVVLLGRDGRATRVLYHALANEFGAIRALLEPPVGLVTLLRRRAERYGWVTVFGQVAFRALAVPYLERSARARVEEILHEQGLVDAPIPGRAVTEVPSATAGVTIEVLRSAHPAVVVVSGARILSRAVLTSVSAPFVNIHVGITPLYRGVHGGYWALVNSDPEHCGVTVHLVDEGIDTGPILAQQRISVTPRDNFATYPVLQLAAAVPALARVVRDTLEGRCLEPVTTVPGASRYWTHPTLWSYLRARVP